MKKNSHEKTIERKQCFPLFLSKRGVTLLEVVIAVGISTLLFASVSTINLLARQTYEFNTTFTEIHGGARMGMDWMTKDIRWANRMLSSITIGNNTYTTGNSEIVLEIPSIDSNGDVILGTNDYVVYHLNSSNATILERTVDADSASSRTDETRTRTNNVNTLNFTSSGTGLSNIGDVTTLSQVEVALATRKTSSTNDVVDDRLNSVVDLRNKEE